MSTKTSAADFQALVPLNPVREALEGLVKGHPFLKGISPHQHRILTDCAMYSHFVADELIFREGDPANRFYLIQTGKVIVEAHVNEQGCVPLQTLEAGDVLGWSWLFPPHIWHFSARALVRTDAIFFYATPLREECDADHELGYELMNRMCATIEERLKAAIKLLMKFGDSKITIYP